MGRIENKPSKDKSYHFLISTTINVTPLVETSSFTNILHPSVEDQINSFVSSDIENENNNSSETLDNDT